MSTTMITAMFSSTEMGLMIQAWLGVLVASPVLGALGISVLAGPLGSLLIWQRLAFMGDAWAHMGLLGVALAVWWDTPYWAMAIVFSGVVSGIYTVLKQSGRFPEDAVLAWMTQTGLACSMIIFAALPEKVRVSDYLFGKWGQWGTGELAGIWGLIAVLIMTRRWIWPLLLQMIVDPDFCQMRTQKVTWIRFLMVWGGSVLVGLALKMVGGLLCASLLVIPAVTARLMARSPEGMMGYAACFACLSTGFGALWATWWSWPVGPTVVMAANSLCALVFLIMRCRWIGH